MCREDASLSCFFFFGFFVCLFVCLFLIFNRFSLNLAKVRVDDN